MTTPDLGRDDVLPFQAENLDVRGRLVRLGPVVDDILSRHDYPDVVSRQLGELLAAAVLMGNTVKFDGTFTIQTKSDGAVPLMVADYTTTGTVRAYAKVDGDAFTKLTDADLRRGLRAVTGHGSLAFTIDQGPEVERYQGIVALDGTTLADCTETYFRNSEQIPTLMRLAARRSGPEDTWQAAGLMLQHLPQGGGGARAVDGHPPGADVADHWVTARAKTATLTDDELICGGLRPEEVLWRLFHEDSVRIFPHHGVRFGCRCGNARITAVLGQFSTEDRAGMAVDGKIEVTCEFCNSRYAFDPVTLDCLPYTNSLKR